MLEQAELTEQGKGVAAGVAHGGRPAGERPGAQMRVALKAAKAGNKKLAAPNGPIGAGAGAVKGDAKDTRVGCKLARGDGLGHHARDMCMMMLDFDKRQIVLPCQFTRPLARQIAGMHVTCQGGRRQVKEVFQARARGVPGIEGLAVFDIADMLRHKTGHMAVGVLARERDRSFLLRPAGEHAGCSAVERRQR